MGGGFFGGGGFGSLDPLLVGVNGSTQPSWRRVNQKNFLGFWHIAVVWVG